MAPPSTSSAPERSARNQAKGRGKKGISTQAVSYTHLDVYKRQGVYYA